VEKCIALHVLPIHTSLQPNRFSEKLYHSWKAIPSRCLRLAINFTNIVHVFRHKWTFKYIKWITCSLCIWHSPLQNGRWHQTNIIQWCMVVIAMCYSNSTKKPATFADGTVESCLHCTSHFNNIRSTSILWTREHVTPCTTNAMGKIQTWRPV